MKIENKELILILDSYGNISTISSVRDGQVISMAQDHLEIFSDFGIFRTTGCTPKVYQSNATSVSYQYDTPSCIYQITYRLSKASYFERILSLIPKQSLTIYKVKTIDLFKHSPHGDLIFHKDFYIPAIDFNENNLRSKK